MNISTAIRRVKDLKGEIAEHLERAKVAVSYKQTELPAFKFEDCIKKADAARQELVRLQARIAKTNSANVIPYKGESITLNHAVLILKELKGQITWFDSLKGIVRNQAVTSQEETTYDYETEKRTSKMVHYTCELPEAKRAEAVDAFKADFRQLNTLIEDMNHRVTLKD